MVTAAALTVSSGAAGRWEWRVKLRGHGVDIATEVLFLLEF